MEKTGQIKMKKIILFAVSCVVLAACTKNSDDATSVNNTPINAIAFEKGQKVSLSISAGEQTKVSSDLNTTTGVVDFKWETGDKIKVTVGTESAEFTLKTGAGESTATFEGTMPAEGETFDVQYPLSDPDLIKQTYVANALPKNKMKMTATGCTIASGFKLTPQYSALRLNIWGRRTVGKIEVVKIGTTDPSYTLKCETGVKVGQTAAEATVFFLVVPDGNYKFSAEIFDNAETPSSIDKFETSSAQTFEAGKYLNMPAKMLRPEGALPGIFSVSADTKVYFAKGNLYYDGSAFKFEDNQYSYASSWNANHVSHLYWSKTATVAVAEKYNESGQTVSDILFTNATPKTPNAGFTVNGATGVWRTLSGNGDGEWKYLLSTRKVNGKTGEGNSYRRATIRSDISGGTYGLIIYPDNYTGQTSATSYTSAQWATMESDGCVFLPATGGRNGSSISSTNTIGRYWASLTLYNNNARVLRFDKDYFITATDNEARGTGCSVRLVTAAQ